MELDGLAEDMKRMRQSAGAAVRAANRQGSSKQLRVRLRLGGRLMRESADRPIYVARPRGDFVEASRGGAAATTWIFS